MDAMVIRDTQLDDAVSVAALIDSVSRERRFLAGTVGFPAESTREFIASVHSANGVHLVAELDGTLVGWCDIVRHHFEGMNHVGRLGMGVRQEFRGRGIGRALLERALARAFELGIERIELEVFASNAKAVRLYEASGFAFEGRKHGARKLDGQEDDILLYAKRSVA